MNDVNRDRVEFLLFTIILVAIVIMVFVLMAIKSDGTKCQIQPLTYGVEQLEKATQSEIECSCRSSEIETSLKFNDEKLWVEEQGIRIDYDSDLNFSELEKLFKRNDAT